jgi:hypothetical protein
MLSIDEIVASTRANPRLTGFIKWLKITAPTIMAMPTIKKIIVAFFELKDGSAKGICPVFIIKLYHCSLRLLSGLEKKSLAFLDLGKIKR